MTPSTPASVLLSTSSVFPEPASAAFEWASALGYDGVEVMVWSDVVSQDESALRGLSDHYAMPVRAIHAPCLAVTQRVWSPDPWMRLRRSAQLAQGLGASIVVVHPPFRWQREYAKSFLSGLSLLGDQFPSVCFAVENMYPLRGPGPMFFVPYHPGWDPTTEGYTAFTLDVSHCSTARRDCLTMADAMGAGLAHIHLADGTGKNRDEHLVPGRGSQPCAQLLRSLGARHYTGAVSVEINTRGKTRDDREKDLQEALSFAREYWARAVETKTPPA